MSEQDKKAFWVITYLLDFVFGKKCPLCSSRLSTYVCESSYNLKNYWCDFCFIEFSPKE
jgi:hypothetical protein